MAGDWIKMRIDLQSHPKIVRILSATNADKFRVIGGLHAVWSVFDAHSVDGVLHGYTPELMDHVIGWQGFSRAMEAVGWLTFDGIETLSMPEFTEHNGKSAKRRGEDQKRKRDNRKPSESCPQDVRNLSEEKRTREEKRRVNISTDVDMLIARGVSEQVAKDFAKLRKGRRAAITETAIKGIEEEAYKAGLSLDAALSICCSSGWQSFKASWDWEGKSAKKSTTVADDRKRATDELTGRSGYGKSGQNERVIDGEVIRVA